MKDLCFKLASLVPHHFFKPSKVFFVYVCLLRSQVCYKFMGSYYFLLVQVKYVQFLKVLKDVCGLVNFFTNAFV